jgi:sporulation protein YlmC with PRC-barrel domain
VTARRRLVRLVDLIGRRVRTATGEPVGRIEEVIAERRGSDHEVTEYHIGPGALHERFGVVSRLFGGKSAMLIVRWDQLDIHEADSPTLTCGVDELKRERR